MKTAELKRYILDTLEKGHYVTADQLLGLLNTSDEVRAIQLGLPRLRETLRAMRRAGSIEGTTESTLSGMRYRMPRPTYYVEPDPSGKGLQLVRRGDIEVVIGKGMTEAEARVCVDALNERDREFRTAGRAG